METCDLYLLVLGLILVGDFTVFLLLPRLIKRPAPDPRASGAEVTPQQNPVVIVRAAIVLSMFIIAGVFVFLLSQNGCLG
jgi:hypothetical protein